MKKLFTLLFTLGLLQTMTYGQNVPQGMKYQAAARDAKGQVMGNQFLQLKVTLYSDPIRREVEYEEIHKVMTNELGLFSLSIGEGLTTIGQFRNVPWSEKEIWMHIAIQTDDETDFITISDSRMLSVPYAFHAATAGEITGSGAERGGTGDPYSKVWSLLSNFNTVPGRDVLGTGDMADLVIVTNATERMRILQTGDIKVANSTEVGRNLDVKRNVYLNTDTLGSTQQANWSPGATINYGDLTVARQSSTYLTGDLTVDGHTELNATLNVDGLASVSNTTQSTASGNGALVVDGGVGIAKNLNVAGATALGGVLNVTGITTIQNTTQSTTINNGALVVDGGAGIEKNLNVGGTANFGGGVNFSSMVHITDLTESTSPSTGALVVDGGVGVGKNLNIGGVLGVKGSNTGYMARIENSDGGSGDGLEIKLGKVHPAWNGSNYLHLTSPSAEFFDSAIATIVGYIDGSETFEPEDLLNFWPNAYIAGTACNLVNVLTDQLNESLGLPFNISTPINDALNLPLDIGYEINSGLGLPGTVAPLDLVNSACDICVDDDDLPGPTWTIVPSLPTNELVIPDIPDFEFPEIPQIPGCEDLPTFGLPVISFVNVNNSLTNDNQFISFKDKDNRELGSIRAQAVTDWQLNFFDGAYITGILSELVGLDLLHALVGGISEFTNIADAYNSIGVEYASGNGDYAEWLERTNPNEFISSGDIVGVKGGKISKDLIGAEQLMAVSSKPIVLGNLPAAEQEHKGNNIAFMGQIPVKVQGPVRSGDYIVGQQHTPGYGIAVSPADLTPELAKLIVGRAWDTNLNPGPKLINTVIGVDNGNFIKLINDNQAEVAALQDRLQALESKMEILMTGLPGAKDISAKMQSGKKDAQKNK